jgi:glycine dehydrogenase
VILEAGRRERINFRKVGTTKIGITVDETIRPAVLEGVWRAFGLSHTRDDFDADYTACPRSSCGRAPTSPTPSST